LNKEKAKLFNVIKSSYSKAPYFKEVDTLLKECLSYADLNLFNFLLNSIVKVNSYLNITTPIVVSSSIDIDHSLKSQNKVLSICNNQNANTYINSIGGVDLYDKTVFKNNNIDLKFIKSNSIIYEQFNNQFIPWLSIIDVMMFNSKEKIQEYLNNYTLI
jgi:hypothetical protein